MTIEPEMLMAYADGELDAEGRRAVEAALAADPPLREELERQRRLQEALVSRYGPVADEEVPDRLVALLAGGEGDKVVDIAAARERRSLFSRPAWQSLGAIAATLVVGVMVGQALPPREAGPVAVEGGTMVARGDLARALETQLAAAPEPGAAHRVGVTFPVEDGRLCRTFEGAAMAGLACRGEEGWALVATAAVERAAQAGEYRQAGAAGALVMEAAQAMMAGEPLDAEQERHARAAGWRLRE